MTLWIHDYTILFQKDKLQLWPTDDMTGDDKLNAISRFVILLSLLGFVLTQSLRFFWIGIVTLFIIVMYNNATFANTEAFTQKTTSHTVPTEKNPLMNVLLPEINGNPNRGKALAYTPKTEKKIMEKVKKGLDPRIYRGTNNELDLEYSMRQFYTNPSTTVPNNQEEFAKFCYGDMISAKEGNEIALSRQNPRIGAVG
jgi:hypothetical protein